jgi:predicted aspartyl protease
MSRRFGLVIFAWLLFSHPLNFSAAEDKKSSSLDEYLKKLGYLPIQLERTKHNVFRLDATVSGKRHYLLVDTGASVTILNPEIATGMTKVDGRNVQLDDEFFKYFHPTNLVAIDELKLGSLRFQNQPALIKEFWMESIAVTEKGILGCDFFYRNHCIIDCTRERLYIRPEELPPSAESALAESLKRSRAEVQLQLTVGFPLICAAKANGKETDIIVDTGAEWTTLQEGWARDLELRTFTSKRLDITGFGKTGAKNARESILETLQIGSVTYSNVPVAIYAREFAQNPLSKKIMWNVHGLLGSENLAEIGAIIDFGSGKMWFDPSSRLR